MGKPLEGIAILLQSSSNDARSRDRCFRRIWEEYYPRLIVFVRGCGGGAGEDAEDIVQEIMEKVYRGIGTYNPTWSFSTWVYTIARNACRDSARRGRRAPAIRSLSDLASSQEPSHARTPEQELLLGDAERRVQEFFAAAEPETRQIAFLRFHQRMRYGEIASVMGMPLGTVKFRVHDIRRKLNLHLEEEHGSSRTLRASAL
jgi:RNA polymerase sigma-70 factor (ECF subfamily)